MKQCVMTWCTSKQWAIHWADDSPFCIQQACINELQLSLSDIIRSSHLLCAVICVAVETETIAEMQSVRRQSGICVCMCVCGLGLRSPARHKNQTRGLSVIILTHSGFSESLLWDYRAIWCWVDCAVIVIIIIIIHHSGLWFMLYVPSCLHKHPMSHYTRTARHFLYLKHGRQSIISKFSTWTEYCSHAAFGSSHTDHNWSNICNHIHITALFYLIHKKTCYCQFIWLKSDLISFNKSIHIVTRVEYFLTITEDWEKTPISPFLITRMFLHPSSLSTNFLWEHANCGDTCFGLSLFVFPPLYVPTAGLLELLRWALCVDS